MVNEMKKHVETLTKTSFVFLLKVVNGSKKCHSKLQMLIYEVSLSHVLLLSKMFTIIVK